MCMCLHGFDILSSLFEKNSPRENDSSKNQPKRLRFDRAREFQSLVGTSQTGGRFARRSHPDGETPLIKACRYGHGACALALLEHAPGLDLDAAGADGATALIHAARFGCCESVDALVGRGADVRAADGDGRTALGYATRGGHLRCAHALAMAGALRAPPPPAPAAAVADHWSGDRAAPAGGTVVDRFFYKLSFPMARPDAAPPPAPPRPPRADLD